MGIRFFSFVERWLFYFVFVRETMVERYLDMCVGVEF